MELLKDSLFNRQTVSILSNQISQVDNSFDQEGFISSCLKNFEGKELKDRMNEITRQLEIYLPYDFIQTMTILEKALQDSTASHFVYGGIFHYIEKNGCTDQYINESLYYLGELTKYFSSEFAIRPFLNNYPTETLSEVHKWALSDDFHKRRLASEGCRPKLPWAPNITIDYKTGAAVLNHLYSDTERYVTRSVANHLNDISKIDPTYVLNTLKKWSDEGKQTKAEMAYIINHSLRTLIKKGHPDTLQFLGYKANPKIVINDFSLEKESIKIGEKLHFEFMIHSNDNAKLIVDYIITYPTKLGKTTKKVYKLKVLPVKKGEIVHIKSSRSFKVISTRTLRAGSHQIDIQVNGQIFISKSFNLTE